MLIVGRILLSIARMFPSRMTKRGNSCRRWAWGCYMESRREAV